MGIATTNHVIRHVIEGWTPMVTVALQMSEQIQANVKTCHSAQCTWEKGVNLAGHQGNAKGDIIPHPSE